MSTKAWMYAVVVCSGAGLPSTAFAQDEEPKLLFRVYGFGQADYVQDFERVNPAWDDTLRPSRIPTDEGTFGADGQAIISPRQSRLGVEAVLPVSDSAVETKFEIDMFGVGVDEGQTTIRLRHAFGEWGPVLGGQTHSVFMDIDVFPNVIDYWGPAGMVFLRNPQLRFMPLRGDLAVAIAIEKPGNDIDAGQVRLLDPELGEDLQPDEELPDLTAHVRWAGGWGHVQLAGILRRVGYETPGTPGNEPDDHDTGWGANLSSNIKLLARDRLILSVVYGEGIASYMNDGGTDLAPRRRGATIRGVTVPLLGIVAYYDHFWTEWLSSSLGYSITQVDNTNFQTPDAFYRGEYASVNLLATPIRNTLAGVEFLWGRRTDNDDDNGEDLRVQVSLKYSFSSTDTLEGD